VSISDLDIITFIGFDTRKKERVVDISGKGMLAKVGEDLVLSPYNPFVIDLEKKKKKLQAGF